MAHNNSLQRPPRPEPIKGPSSLPLAFPPGQDYLLELFGLKEPMEALKKHGYVMEPLNKAELQKKAKCKHCNQSEYKVPLAIFSLIKDLQKKIQYRLDNPAPPPPQEAWDPLPTILVKVGLNEYETQQCAISCRYHPGVVDRYTKCYTCCDKHVSEAKPCVTVEQHQIRNYAPDELARCYQFYSKSASSNAQGRSIPIAVAIDCEMGTAITGDSELIRLTAIDYMTGEVLINNLVQPDQQMLHLNTRYSGVTWKQMDEARRKRACLMGKAGAREALWRFVDPATILIGHGLSNDLRALRLIHPTVIDTYTIEHRIVQAKKKAEEEAAAAAATAATAAHDPEASVTESEEPPKDEPSSELAEVQAKDKKRASHKASPKPVENHPKKKKTKGTGDLALKTMMKKYLGRDVQMQGNNGHDSFEDALAARDLVHWMVMQRLEERKKEEELVVVVKEVDDMGESF